MPTVALRLGGADISAVGHDRPRLGLSWQTTAGRVSPAGPWLHCPRVRSGGERGVDMADKSPRKIASKKSGKTLKGKRQEKKDKQQVRKGFIP